MRLRRIVCIAIGVAMSATVGLASAKAATSNTPAPDAAPRLLLVDAAITPVVGRAAPSWADKHADDRGPSNGLFTVLAETPHLLELAWVGILLASLAWARQRPSSPLHVRGPPASELV